MPLTSSYVLSKAKGREAWVIPVVDRTARAVSFSIGGPPGGPPEPTKTGRGASFRCLVCGQVAPDDYAKAQGRANRMGAQLMALAADGPTGRVYVAPDDGQVRIAGSAIPEWTPQERLSTHPQYMAPPRYGMLQFKDLFTPRQLVLMSTFGDLVEEAAAKVLLDAEAAGLANDGIPLRSGGAGALAYSQAVSIYLAEATSKLATFHNSLSYWRPVGWAAIGLGRQALAMTWDYAESNPFGGAGGDVRGVVSAAPATVLGSLFADRGGVANQGDARGSGESRPPAVVSTDPPYYDNVPYADLSDFFYVWLRRSLDGIYPELFATVLTPKSSELVADLVRFGGREAARRQFEQGLESSFATMRAVSDPSFPTTVYYAYRQAETDAEANQGLAGVASTGWETMLEALLRSGFSIGGTWPMRTESTIALKATRGALASSIVLVCRPRHTDVGVTTRKAFVASLKNEMPEAIRTLQHGSIAPVDLAQSSIGPGMAIFSRYARVLEPDGSAMRVRTALALINQVLDELLTEQEGEFDADTRWAIAWYEQFGLSEAAYGTAETLSKAKNTSVAGVVDAGIVAASRGHVRLLGRAEYSGDWDPAKDARLPVWEATQRLVHALLTDGEVSAGALLARLGGLGDTARDLAYRMYQVAERKGWTDEARAYNALVVAWTDLSRSAESSRAPGPAQTNLGLE
jgi:putative DNA methylase